MCYILAIVMFRRQVPLWWAYYHSPASTRVIIGHLHRGGVAYYLALLPLLLLLSLPLTTLFETYTRLSQFVEVNGNKIF